MPPLAGPRARRQDAYVGDRSLFTPAANKVDRKRLVGILDDGGALIPTGAHAIERAAGRKRSLGYVTSSYLSAQLGHPIALGLIEGGAERGAVELEHLGRGFRARVVLPCFLDPKGERLNA